MSEAIITAIITAIGAVLGQWIISSQAKRKTSIEEAKREQRLNDRLEVIEHKLDEHNGYAQKFEKIQIDITKISTKLESMEGKT